MNNSSNIDRHSDDSNRQAKREIQEYVEGRLWTVNDVAEYLGFSPNTIYRAVSEGRIPCIKVFSAVRFRREEIVEWAKKSKKKPHRSA